MKFVFLLAVVGFDLEAHDLLEAHGALHRQRQRLAGVEVGADRARDRLVVLERQVQVLALLEVLVQQRQAPVLVDVDELQLGLGDDGARHRERRGADQLVLLEAEDVLARDGALGAAVLAVLEDVDLGHLAGAPADADEVAALEIARRARKRSRRARVGALELLVVEVLNAVLVVVVVVLSRGIIKIFLVAIHRGHFG